ncbi:hypothetical protein SAMN04487894_104317 [Niabella drilacis]|uniref:Uncharacterized protein n=1 Tax=Niabella drilacis (strain DSM 25811 / CCM 8410 / CCUG 62505 / LMG 26954 / E90) TaxID=1285928 RepID=A0A1G6Q8I2_NIADE|nr:hypothetical protein SAMN04487894_104317 [Niabella drilacis]
MTIICKKTYLAGAGKRNLFKLFPVLKMSVAIVMWTCAKRSFIICRIPGTALKKTFLNGIGQ